MDLEAPGIIPGIWNIQLFGRLSAQRDERQISRFRTHKTGALLACLAQDPDRAHRRDDLCALLWPHYELASARNCLRIALSSLRIQFEPNPAERGKVIIADRQQVHLDPGLFITDKAVFEGCISQAAVARDNRSRAAFLQQAVDLYQIGLLPGFNEGWISAERQRLADSYVLALRQLVQLYVNLRDFQSGLNAAQKAVTADPLREESRRLLVEVNARLGRPSAALQSYRDMQKVLPPSPPILPAVRPGPDPSIVEEANGPAEAAIAPTTDSPARSIRTAVGAVHRLVARLSPAQRVCGLLDTPGTRLVTITGPPGIGKTRLALIVAERLAAQNSIPVWFVSLEDVIDASLVIPTIASGLQLPRFTPLTRWYQLRDALAAQPSILLLDAVDHLVDEVRSIVTDLLTAVPSLRCVTISRHRLNLADEYEHAVRPLRVPAAGDIDDLKTIPSCRLWLERAQVVRPNLKLPPSRRKAVAALCRRLEGVPLAIELVAAWTGTFSPAQVLDAILKRDDVLYMERRISDRFQTVYTVLDWCWRRLPAGGQRFLARLSVFRGGCTVEAAEMVCVEPRAQEHLDQFHERALVSRIEVDGEWRYSLRSCVREFGESHLSVNERTECLERHLTWFSQMAERAEAASATAEANVWLHQLRREQSNLRVALRYCLVQPDRPELALSLGTRLFWFWYAIGDPAEGRQWLAESLEKSSGPGSLELRESALAALDTLAFANET